MFRESHAQDDKRKSKSKTLFTLRGSGRVTRSRTLPCCSRSRVSRHMMWKPSLSRTASEMRSVSCSLLVYSGNSKWLKQVCADGNLQPRRGGVSNV